MREVSKEEAIESLRKKYTQEEIDIIFAFHTDHKIVEAEHGRHRWEEVLDSNTEGMTPNDMAGKFYSDEITLEEYMGYYRDIGYSLYGYWEIFCFNNDFDVGKYNIEIAEKRDELIDNVLKSN